MPLNLIADFFSIIDIPLFDTAAVVFIISFIIWEVPRTIKIISEEYTKGLYPENGRVVDIIMFLIGAITLAWYLIGDDLYNVVEFLKTPGITAFFLILMVAIPLIIIMGYLKRFFGRMDSHNSLTIFLTHAFLDLMHVLFQISLVVFFIPALGYFLVGWLIGPQ